MLSRKWVKGFTTDRLVAMTPTGTPSRSGLSGQCLIELGSALGQLVAEISNGLSPSCGCVLMRRVHSARICRDPPLEVYLDCFRSRPVVLRAQAMMINYVVRDR